MSYLSYLCLFAYSGAQHIMCCVFVLFFFVLCTVLYDASFSGLSFVLLSLRLSIIDKCIRKKYQTIKHTITKELAVIMSIAMLLFITMLKVNMNVHY
jgi:hypothetical protein